MGNKTHPPKVDLKVVAEEAEVLLKHGPWEMNNGQASLTINRDMVTQPRTMVAEQIKEKMKAKVAGIQITIDKSGKGITLSTRQLYVERIHEALGVAPLQEIVEAEPAAQKKKKPKHFRGREDDEEEEYRGRW